MNRNDLWLFAGVYLSLEPLKAKGKGFPLLHRTYPDKGTSLRGRLVVQYKRKGRNSCPYGESLKDSALVYEVKPAEL